VPRSSTGPEGALGRAVEGRLAWAERLFGELRERTKDDVGITRAAWGEGEQRAWELMAEAARGLGLEVSPDAAGNPADGDTTSFLACDCRIGSRGRGAAGPAALLLALALALAPRHGRR